MLGLDGVGESDGRCVRASEPNSKRLSICFLLLNPPLGTSFRVPSVVSCITGNVAHFFPLRALHLDLTFLGEPI